MFLPDQKNFSELALTEPIKEGKIISSNTRNQVAFLGRLFGLRFKESRRRTRTRWNSLIRVMIIGCCLWGLLNITASRVVIRFRIGLWRLSSTIRIMYHFMIVRLVLFFGWDYIMFEIMLIWMWETFELLLRVVAIYGTCFEILWCLCW